MTNVTADKDGNVICGLKKSEKDGKTYGYIRVEETKSKFANGFVRVEKRSALITGEESVLKALGWAKGQSLPGKIAFIESTVQRHPSNEPKRAGKDGAILMSQGQPIYRYAEYTEDLAKQDILVQHDAVNEMVAASSKAING